MMWDGLGDFLAMGGHAPYVWSSYGAALVLLVMEALLLRRRRQRHRNRLIGRSRRAASTIGLRARARQ